MAEKVDLFGFFKEANNGNFAYIDELSDEEVKSLSPFVLTMWANGAQSNTAAHVILTDLYMNDKVFSLSKHPRLLLKLFIEANSGMGNTRYKFVKSVSSRESADTKMIANHFNVGYDVAKGYRELMTDEDLKTMKEIYQ